MVAARSAGGVATIPCATLESRIANARAVAFSAPLNSTHALMASMASFGPDADMSAKEPDEKQAAMSYRSLQSNMTLTGSHSLASICVLHLSHTRTCLRGGRENIACSPQRAERMEARNQRTGEALKGAGRCSTSVVRRTVATGLVLAEVLVVLWLWASAPTTVA